MENEETVKCENCRLDILKSKIVLHQSFCLRNNKYCPTCSKVFLISEFDEHLKTHNPENKKLNIKEPTKIKAKFIQTIPEKTSITNQKIEKEFPKKININQKEEEPEKKKRQIHVDDSLGFKKCEYCYNMFENLKEHYLKCPSKKFIEEENAKYNKELKKRMEEDVKLANKLSKEKFIDTTKDEILAKKLQKELKPILDTGKDEILAKKLQKELKPIYDTKKDEEIAKKLQKQFGTINTSKDDEIARKMQKEFNEQNLREIQKNNENIVDMDDDLKRALEESKKDY